MFFASPWLLGLALPLALLPILLHRRARRRERSRDFPGAFFLDQPAQPAPVSSQRLEDPLLLALRCAALFLLALALSGPQLPPLAFGTRLLAPAYPPDSTVLLVLDDAPRLLERRNAQGRPVLEAGLRRLAEELQRVQARVGVETASGKTWAWQDAATFARRWPELLSGPAQPGERLEALRRGDARLREVLAQQARTGTASACPALIFISTESLATDEQNPQTALRQLETFVAAWRGPAASESGPALFTWLYPARLSANPTAQQWWLELQPERNESPWLEDNGIPLRFTEDHQELVFRPLAGQPARVRLQVRCGQGAGTRHVQVEAAEILEAAGAPKLGRISVRLERDVSLNEGESETLDVPLLVPSGQAAPLWLRASFSAHDALPYDDFIETVYAPEPRREVWWLDARVEPAARSPQGQELLAHFSAGLAPLANTSAGRIHLQPLPREGLADWARTFPRGAALAVLYSPGRVEPQMEWQLREAVRAGAGVLWIPAFDPAHTHPAQVLAPAGKFWEIERIDYNAPWLVPFQLNRNGALSELQARWRVQDPVFLERPSNPTEDVRELLTLKNVGPALITWRRGRGLDTRWALGLESAENGVGGLAASPAFPALLASWIEWSHAARVLNTEDWALPFPSRTETASGNSWRGVLPPGVLEQRMTLDGPWDLADAQGGPGGAGDQAAAAGQSGLVAAPRPSHAVREVWTIPAGQVSTAIPRLSQPGLYRLIQEQGTHWLRVKRVRAESQLEPLPAEWRSTLNELARKTGGAALQPEADGVAAALALRQALPGLAPGRSLEPLSWFLFAVAAGLELFILARRGLAA